MRSGIQLRHAPPPRGYSMYLVPYRRYDVYVDGVLSGQLYLFPRSGGACLFNNDGNIVKDLSGKPTVRRESVLGCLQVLGPTVGTTRQETLF